MIDWAIVGKRVVCIVDISEYSFYNKESYPYINQILTIRETRVYKQQLYLMFEEIINIKRLYEDVNVDTEMGFCYEYFRPVKETSIESFKSILTSIPNNKEMENA